MGFDNRAARHSALGVSSVAAAFVLIGCSRAPEGAGGGAPAGSGGAGSAATSSAAAGSAATSSAAAGSAAAKGVLAIGEPITAPAVALSDIAKNPGAYANKRVTTSGKVTAVCQEMGCWMEIQDASGQAHVRMHGHSFFVPKTASGHLARVQATVLTSPDESCTDSPPPAGKGTTAKIDLDATGVELD
jgi:hypothetical protein